jgi:hypothetical protein
VKKSILAALAATSVSLWCGSLAFAQTDVEDAKLLTACIAKLGLADAARPQTEGDTCIGLVWSPCLPDSPNTAETITCISKEDAAWVRLTDDALAAAKLKMTASAHRKLVRRREAWIKALPKVCAPEEEGSLAYVESEFCEGEEVAKLAVDMITRASK